MSLKQTPAPWRLTYSNCWIVGNDDKKGEIVIAKMEAGTLADAKLLAAAPDLLKSLQKIVRGLNVDNYSSHKLSDQKPMSKAEVSREAMAAIAKVIDA